MKYSLFTAGLYILLSLSSCKKLLEVEPAYIKTASQIYGSDSSANEVVASLYSKMITNSYESSIPLSTAVLSDEMLPIGYAAQTYQDWYINTLKPNTSTTNAFWTDSYNLIYLANSIIEGLNKYTGVSDAGKKQFIGEAQFIRAFVYFYLVNFYGDVPMITVTDYKKNSSLPRVATDSIYHLIIRDLSSAEDLLHDSYPSSGRVRANKWAAKALLSRVYLYTGDSVNAGIKASEVIGNNSVYSLEPLDKIFQSDSREALLQEWNQQGVALGMYTQGGNASFAVSPPLLDAFDASDNRKASFINEAQDEAGNRVYLNYKYRLSLPDSYKEYNVVLRLAEQYLIRAEALAKQGQLVMAIADINMIRERAGLEDLPSTLQKDDILSAIEQERRVELCFEWADRWLNLKRLHHLDAVMQVAKPATWLSTSALLPVPYPEIQTNRALTQNPGYN